MAVNLTLSLGIRGRETLALDLGTALMEHTIDRVVETATGTVDNQQDRIWSDTRTLVATSESLDFNNNLQGALAGTLLTFVEIRGIYIRNKAAAAAQVLTVGNAASPAFTGLFGAAAHTITVPAGGVFLWTAPLDGGGLTVTGTTNDLLKIDSGANTVTYDIVVWGVSA
jgi:hypothetical protein